ncbi:MAG TPA: CBS domain-containing protein [Burkholderiales bacterium]
MKVKDVMSSPVVSVRPEATVAKVAALLYERRISAVPVVHLGRLVGIVSEGDLLRRHEIGTDEERASVSWWSRLFAADRAIEAYIRSHARHVGDLMTREVVSTTPDAPLGEVAALLETRRIKRLPVLEAGRLVGMVSRSDLVRALASRSAPPELTRPPSDAAIRSRLLRELERQPWWHGHPSQVSVQDGVVIYSGAIDDAAECAAARVAAENIPGVRRVEDRRLLFRDLPSMV